MGAKEIMFTSLIITLFVFAFISFGVNFASETESALSITNDSRIGNLYSGVNGSIFADTYDGKTLAETANETADDYDSDDTSGVTNFLTDKLTDVIKGSAKLVMGVTYSIFDSILDPILSIMFPNSPGTRQAVGIVLTAIISFLLVFAVWRLIKSGQ